jgi:hypothetical protein
VRRNAILKLAAIVGGFGAALSIFAVFVAASEFAKHQYGLAAFDVVCAAICVGCIAACAHITTLLKRIP